MEDDKNYFDRRAQQERVAAMTAADERARQAHLELADRYSELVTSERPERRNSGPNSSAAKLKA